MINPTHTATVVSSPDCVQCNATYRALDKKGAVYTVDLDPESNDHVLAKDLGFMRAPVVLIRDKEGALVDEWSGFQPDKITKWGSALAQVQSEAVAA